MKRGLEISRCSNSQFGFLLNKIIPSPKRSILKRSQVSVFVIVAIVVVISLLIYFAVRVGFVKFGVSSEVRPIYNFVSECVDKTAEDSIYHIGQYGGYFVVPEKSTESNIPYYFDKGKKLILSKQQIEKELSKYVNNMLFFCVKNFVDFPDFNVEQKEIESNVKILPGKVVFNIDFPLTITKGENSFFIENFNVEINSRLDTIYEVASGIIEEQMKDEKNICINCIENIAFERKIFVGMNDDPLDSNTIIFSLIDEEEKIKNEEYRFYFANRYELG